MEPIKITDDIEYVNTAEAKFGEAYLLDNMLIIPYFNLHFTENDNSILEKISGKYIEFAYLVFKNVRLITWDYDVSRIVDAPEGECYGGVQYFSNEYKEFWISYEKASIYVNKEISISDRPFVERKELLDNFLRISNSINWVKAVMQ